ncbi:hypothetical protein OCH239_14600 [Roseivivax halodurans JCM 10272]|uniref:Type IV pilus biogenesis n=1 Tax=Roseivivax halodurans JCM 10272 TaxID=1449350 RepID=X7EKI6_9RHOB|nr:hypothetical protein [Roseivivax halodurans]ETX15701.1 hypothetical protein OCH239_14600 [Roseivivax halodurans JCM 10272]
MIPEFALNLSVEGISLLRRVEGGWAVLGEAALDGDLEEEMRKLRDIAAAAAPDGTCVKLVIPEDQIKFLDIRDPGTDAERAAAARAALEGATPYEVADLQHDWSVAKGRLFVAALARETLDEAEQFALTHGFRPVSAVAMPHPSKFDGEPFFGPVRSWDGAAPERDRPIRMVRDNTAAPAAPAGPRKAPPTGNASPEPAAPAFSSVRARQGKDASQSASPLNDGDRLSRPVPQRPDAEEVRSRLRSIAASDPALDDAAPASPEIPETSPRKRGLGVFRKKSAARDGEAPGPSSAARPDPKSAHGAPSDAQTRIAALRPGREPGAAAKVDEAQRMTMFGARTEPEPKVGGKPRFLGLTLTAALLLFLVAVAAWASFSMEDGLARILRSAPEPASQISSASTQNASDGVDQAGATQASADPAGSDAESDASAPATQSPETARTDYAATGIWQRSPTAPAEPSAGALDTDDVYLLSLDAPVTELDAVALPDTEGAANDAPYPAPMPPAPAGVDFDLDDRGLVRATDEGAINPDRVRVFAGLPPVVPPTRSSVLPGGAEEVQSVEDAERLDALGGLRPEGRPVTLIEDTERLTFRGATIEELASRRPALRPAPAKAEAEEDTTATERAVVASLVPSQRPGDFETVVEETRRLAAQVAPRTVAPSAPSGSTVAERATVRDAVDLRQMNLIGVYGEPSSRRALVRLPNGRYEKVKVGDSVNGGRIAAIGEDQIRYVKGGQNMTLRMP